MTLFFLLKEQDLKDLKFKDGHALSIKKRMLDIEKEEGWKILIFNISLIKSIVNLYSYSSMDIYQARAMGQ